MSSPKLLRGLLSFSSMTMVSRVLGLVRDFVVTTTFGTNAITDAFWVAFRVPNFLRRLFAEGSFATAFVPVFTEVKETRSHAELRELMARTAGTLGGVLMLVTALALIFAPQLASVFSSGVDTDPVKQGLLVDLFRLTFPFLLFVSLTALAGGALNTYQGNLKLFLDDTSRQFNSDWQNLKAVAQSRLSELENAIVFGMEIFGKDYFCRKWSVGGRQDPEGHFERSINRAVFDIQVYSLSLPEVRDKIAGRGPQVIDEFKKACIENVPFSRSITSTTKTVEAFTTRHRVWQEIIKSQCGIDYQLPAPLKRP